MSVPITPRNKTSFNTTTPSATPARLQASTAAANSPHYQTSRRHSLYGIEDRVVLDPGSRVWKVGFSGEGRPRDVFYPSGTSKEPLWSLTRANDLTERAEQDKLLEIRLEACLRSLLTDPKSRKIILVEHPLLPLYVKEALARILFDNLQVPSISFASSHLLSLLAVGRITGLVLDCGYLESTALPIYASRPLFPHLRTTPLAGERLASHIRSLLLLFGTYLPPPTSLSAAANIPAANRSTRVPSEVLTDAVVENIITRCCFVGQTLDRSPEAARASSPAGDEFMDIDIPPSDATTQSDTSEFSHLSVPSSQHDSSEFSMVSSHARAPSGGEPQRGESQLQSLASMYTRHSTATDLQMRVVPPLAQQTGTGRGTLIIPGWIRERAAEVLFEGGDVDESSVAEVLLDSLLKVPVDLRKIMASSILVVGGTLMLPGFILRLHAELIHAVEPPTSSESAAETTSGPTSPPSYDKYAALRPLLPYFAILNNPAPPPSKSSRAEANAGKAPAFSPATLAWVGGSLAGSLKTGGAEVAREKWDDADPNREDEDSPTKAVFVNERSPRNVLPDWTRMPLPMGAPSALKLAVEVM